MDIIFFRVSVKSFENLAFVNRGGILPLRDTYVSLGEHPPLSSLALLTDLVRLVDDEIFEVLKIFNKRSNC